MWVQRVRGWVVRWKQKLKQNITPHCTRISQIRNVCFWRWKRLLYLNYCYSLRYIVRTAVRIMSTMSLVADTYFSTTVSWFFSSHFIPIILSYFMSFSDLLSESASLTLAIYICFFFFQNTFKFNNFTLSTSNILLNFTLPTVSVDTGN